MLINIFGYFVGYWECCSGCGSDDMSRIFRIGGLGWLGEFEGGEIEIGIVFFVVVSFYI